jgi:hypothetical protein
MSPASLAPEQDLHFVLCDYGRFGHAYVETDPTQADASTSLGRSRDWLKMRNRLARRGEAENGGGLGQREMKMPRFLALNKYLALDETDPFLPSL